MSTSPSTNTAIPNSYSIPFVLALIAAGLAGNYFNFPIFLNIDFIFGSIFAMLALQFLGLGRGILAAAIIASSTYFLWDNPYAIITMTAEIATVGWLMGRRKMGLVLTDTLYWLIIGMPLVYLFYHVVMHVPFSNTYIIMTKQAVNGIANALVARLIFTGYALRSRRSQMSYSEIVYNLLAFFVLCPTLIMLAVGSRTDFAQSDRHVRSTLAQNSKRIDQRLDTWVLNRQSAIHNLAEMAASRSPQQMQPYIEMAKKSDLNFLRIGLHDSEATTTAYFPLIDELGKRTIGNNFPDQPFIPMLKKTLKPMLSEVAISRTGIPKPTVAMLAPVVIRGEYGGYVAGILSLEQIREHLDKSTDENAMLYTLLDKNSNVIMTNRTDQKIMTPFVRGKGTLHRLDKEIVQWIPVLPHNTHITERGKNSLYIAETAIGNLEEWRLILEQPMAPFQQKLYDNYTGKLTMLFMILLGALVLAEFLSRRFMVTLEKLRQITCDLPPRLASGATINWPESVIIEADHLINNFKEMAASLTTQFYEVRQINESLEQRVEERTNELAKIMNELEIIMENAPIGISKITDRQQVWVNRKAEDMFQYSKEEMEFQTTRKLYPSDEAYEKFGQEAYPALAHGQVFETVQELIRKDGVHILVRYIGKALESQDISKGTLWLLEDITERMQSEEKIIQLNYELESRVRERTSELESLNKELEGFCYAISHEFRAPIARMEGFGSMLLETLGEDGEESIIHCARRIVAAGNRLRTVIDSLLTMNRLSRADILLSPVNLSEMSMQIVAELLEQIDNRIIKINIAPDIVVQGDHYMLEICMRNLLGNALKFTSKTVEASIEFGKFCSEGVHIYFVRDNGVGFDMKYARNLFVPFCRLHNESEFEGTGIGLATVQRIIDKHNGRIWAEAELGKGATFYFTLGVTGGGE